MDLLFEILTLQKPSIFIREYEEEIFNLIPELEICKGFKQNNDWHIFDVYTHILHVVDYVPSDINIRLAALFHDIGKPKTYTEDENKVGHFYGHWDKSKDIFLSFAKRNRLDEKMINQISKLIEYHDINTRNMSQEDLEILLNKFTKEELIMLFKLKRADLLSQNTKYHHLLETYESEQKRTLKLKEQI